MDSLTWYAVLAWRLRRQHLATRAPLASAREVASDIGGLHAQVMSCAELTLWARVDGLERGWVAQALWKDRTLVKTWAIAARCTCCAPTSSRDTSAHWRG